MSVLSDRRVWLEENRRRIGLEIPLASYFTAAILLALAAADEQMWHWFVIPVFACGVLIGSDAVQWLRGKYDLFDPKGIVGIYGWYFFFLAPLLFIHWDTGMPNVDNPPDWRPWVGYLSISNAVSLVIYKIFQSLGFRARTSNKRMRWAIDAEHALPFFLAFGGVALMAQAYYFVRVGGIAGIVNRAAVLRETGRLAAASVAGSFAIAGNSLPLIVFFYLTLIRARLCEKRSSLVTVGVLISILTITQLVLGGMEGTRGPTVWSLFWITGVGHQFWRPISRRIAVIGLLILIAFLYVYAFYKGGASLGGSGAIEMLVAGVPLSELEEETGRTFSGMLIGDLSRVDTQSYELYRLQISTDYDLRWGKTYIVGLTRRAPGWIWRSRPPDPERVVAGTELFYGRGSYVPGDRFRNSSKVYGMAGEAMLNFGIFSAPIPFAIWGFLMGRFRRVILGWPKTDARRFLAPFVTLLLIMPLFFDLDELFSIAVGQASFVTPLILLSSKRSTERISS